MPSPTASEFPTRYFTRGNLTLVWDTIKPDVLSRVKPTSVESNISSKDYVGPDACNECHSANYRQWTGHPHRWLNALATNATVKGDFSGSAKIRYRGGVGTFYREEGKFLMRFHRQDLTRVYEMNHWKIFRGHRSVKDNSALSRSCDLRCTGYYP